MTATLNAPQTLSPEQLETYRRTGYIILRGLFRPEEIAVWMAESDRLLTSDLVAPNNLRTSPRKLADGRLQCERFDPVIDVSPVFKSVVYDERILGPLRDIFDGDDATLFKDKLIFKVPGMSGYTMHQDYAWWQPTGPDSMLAQVGPDDILSVAIAIDGAETSNGALELFEGYHHNLLTPKGELRNMALPESDEWIDEARGELIATQPGDVIIFHSLAPHRSGNNTSDRGRRQLYMTYNSAKCGDFYAAQQQHYHQYSTKARSSEGLNDLYFK
jgi:ectoine hydroxylase-related dioxygenase (phytanoyl-CoA dioxygenase family)